MKQSKLPRTPLLLLLSGFLCASSLSAGGLGLWPVGEVAVQSLNASQFVLAVDTNRDGISERLLVVTTKEDIAPLSISGRAQVATLGDQLLLSWIPSQDLSKNIPALAVGFTHIAEYRGPEGRVQLDSLQEMTSEAGAEMEKGIDPNPPQPAPGPGGCAASCSVGCRDGSSCNVTCPVGGTTCANCICPASCTCVVP